MGGNQWVRIRLEKEIRENRVKQKRRLTQVIFYKSVLICVFRQYVFAFTLLVSLFPQSARKDCS